MNYSNEKNSKKFYIELWCFIMQNFFKEKNISAHKLQKEKKVQEYINKYLREIQRHFDMPDSELRLILHRIYKELSPYHFIKIMMKNKLDMLKSFYQKIFRKRK